MIYPWQQQQWQLLMRAREENRLPHAILLHGIAGVGKAQFANALTFALLCARVNANGEGCAVCHACRLLATRAHPNVLWIEPEKTGHAIKVDQIREMNEFVQQSSLQDGYRIVIVNPANQLNMNAANALLKTLEEPSKGAIIILVAEQYERLPKTIVSRCQRMIFPKPDHALALTWLQTQSLTEIDPALLLNIAQGAPLKALQLQQEGVLAVRKIMFAMLSNVNQDPLKAAAELADHESLLIIDFMLSWLTDLLRLQLQMDVATLTNQDVCTALSVLKDRQSVEHTVSLVDHLQMVRKQLNTGVNLNKQLLLENIFIKWGAHVSS